MSAKTKEKNKEKAPLRERVPQRQQTRGKTEESEADGMQVWTGEAQRHSSTLQPGQIVSELPHQGRRRRRLQPQLPGDQTDFKLPTSRRSSILQVCVANAAKTRT